MKQERKTPSGLGIGRGLSGGSATLPQMTHFLLSLTSSKALSLSHCQYQRSKHTNLRIKYREPRLLHSEQRSLIKWHCYPNVVSGHRRDAVGDLRVDKIGKPTREDMDGETRTHSVNEGIASQPLSELETGLSFAGYTSLYMTMQGKLEGNRTSTKLVGSDLCSKLTDYFANHFKPIVQGRACDIGGRVVSCGYPIWVLVATDFSFVGRRGPRTELISFGAGAGDEGHHTSTLRDETLVIRCQLGLGRGQPNKECLEVYKEKFESPFLAATESYYGGETMVFLNSACCYQRGCSITSGAGGVRAARETSWSTWKKAKWRLKEEDERWTAGVIHRLPMDARGSRNRPVRSRAVDRSMNTGCVNKAVPIRCRKKMSSNACRPLHFWLFGSAPLKPAKVQGTSGSGSLAVAMKRNAPSETFVAV
ncbi:hypothetical protein C8F04DRAFT_1181502 [Mycena alexandri]|uniref:Uncharacterized protein n=1 Tax=Mycena alexandri TaxID=1745969 RepID=A0AAD6SYX6_9AGAR|nr:hypothetical protein C8F04DRAFT_1181502 [Mycena alexandri]